MEQQDWPKPVEPNMVGVYPENSHLYRAGIPMTQLHIPSTSTPYDLTTSYPTVSSSHLPSSSNIPTLQSHQSYPNSFHIPPQQSTSLPYLQGVMHSSQNIDSQQYSYSSIKDHQDSSSSSGDSCLDENQYRRGPWTPVEDNLLMNCINSHGPNNWIQISQVVKTRTPKQCRERYYQSLRPNIRHEPITQEEGEIIMHLVDTIGKRWAEIARKLDGRSDNMVKNWWNGQENKRKNRENRLRCGLDPDARRSTKMQRSSKANSTSNSPPTGRITKQTRKSSIVSTDIVTEAANTLSNEILYVAPYSVNSNTRILEREHHLPQSNISTPRYPSDFYGSSFVSSKTSADSSLRSLIDRSSSRSLRSIYDTAQTPVATPTGTAHNHVKVETHTPAINITQIIESPPSYLARRLLDPNIVSLPKPVPPVTRNVDLLIRPELVDLNDPVRAMETISSIRDLI